MLWYELHSRCVLNNSQVCKHMNLWNTIGTPNLHCADFSLFQQFIAGFCTYIECGTHIINVHNIWIVLKHKGICFFPGHFQNEHFLFRKWSVTGCLWQGIITPQRRFPYAAGLPSSPWEAVWKYHYAHEYCGAPVCQTGSVSRVNRSGRAVVAPPYCRSTRWGNVPVTRNIRISRCIQKVKTFFISQAKRNWFVGC